MAEPSPLLKRKVNQILPHPGDVAGGYPDVTVDRVLLLRLLEEVVQQLAVLGHEARREAVDHQVVIGKVVIGIRHLKGVAKAKNERIGTKEPLRQNQLRVGLQLGEEVVDRIGVAGHCHPSFAFFPIVANFFKKSSSTPCNQGEI